MKELSFKEVIANIKTGEVWESAFKSIWVSNEGDIIIRNIGACPQVETFVFQPITKYRLKEEKEELTIQEAGYKSLWENKRLRDYANYKGGK